MELILSQNAAIVFGIYAVVLLMVIILNWEFLTKIGKFHYVVFSCLILNPLYLQNFNFFLVIIIVEGACYFILGESIFNERYRLKFPLLNSLLHKRIPLKLAYVVVVMMLQLAIYWLVYKLNVG